MLRKIVKIGVLVLLPGTPIILLFLKWRELCLQKVTNTMVDGAKDDNSRNQD